MVKKVLKEKDKEKISKEEPNPENAPERLQEQLEMHLQQHMQDQEMDVIDVSEIDTTCSDYLYDEFIKYVSTSSSSSSPSFTSNFSSTSTLSKKTFDPKRIVFNPDEDLQIENERIINLIKNGHFLDDEEEKKILNKLRITGYKYYKNLDCIEEEVVESQQEIKTLFNDIIQVMDKDEHDLFGENSFTTNEVIRFCNCTFCSLFLSEYHLDYIDKCRSDNILSKNELHETINLIKVFLTQFHVPDQYLPTSDKLTALLPRFDDQSINQYRNLFFALDNDLNFVNFSKKSIINKRPHSIENQEAFLNKPSSYYLKFTKESLDQEEDLMKPGPSGLNN